MEVEEWECGQEESENEVVELPNEEILWSDLSSVPSDCWSQMEYLPRNVKEKKKVSIDEMIRLFEVINASGVPNFQGCRI